MPFPSFPYTQANAGARTCIFGYLPEARMDTVASHLKIINQFFELEKKLAHLPGAESTQRNLARIRDHFNEIGYQIHNPQGERYSDTRTDCEASISGTSTENLFVEQVIKPIVHRLQDGSLHLLQKGVVITKSRS